MATKNNLPIFKIRKARKANRNEALLALMRAEEKANDWLKKNHMNKVAKLGLPETDGWYGSWRIPVLNKSDSKQFGEIIISAAEEDKNKPARFIEVKVVCLTRQEYEEMKKSGRI